MKFIKDWIQPCKQWVSSWRLEKYSGEVSCAFLALVLFCVHLFISAAGDRIVDWCLVWSSTAVSALLLWWFFNKAVFVWINSLTHRLRKGSKSNSVYCSYKNKASTVIFCSIKIKLKSLMFEETQICVAYNQVPLRSTGMGFLWK